MAKKGRKSYVRRVNEQNEHLKKAAFLEAYAECGNVSDACRIAGVGRTTHYGWLKDDPEYEAGFRGAQEDANDAIEREIRRRGKDGWDEPLSHQGVLTGATVRKYSDTLLIFLAKGNMPEKYRDNHKVEHAGDVKITDVKQLTVEQLEEIVSRGVPTGRGGGVAADLQGEG